MRTELSEGDAPNTFRKKQPKHKCYRAGKETLIISAYPFGRLIFTHSSVFRSSKQGILRVITASLYLVG